MKVMAGLGGSDDGRLDRLTNFAVPFQNALAQIMPQRRHLTLADAIHIVDTECSKWGVRPPREAVGRLARGALDPDRHFKHPLQAHREGWRWGPRGGWRHH